MRIFTLLICLFTLAIGQANGTTDGYSSTSGSEAMMTNDVFFFITEGGPLASLNATVSLTSTDTSFSFTTSDPFGGEVISGVPFGTYNYTISKDCFHTITDVLVVDENGGMGISVFADLQAETSNNVFFFISEGSPLASLGAMVTLSNADTSYSFTTSDPFGGEMLADVPYGDYIWTVTKECFVEAAGDITVGCNEGMGVSVFVNLEAGGTNNVFFFITEGGPLASLGTMVTFTNDNTSYSFTTSDPFGGEMLADVPAGDYTYTMTKDCFLEATGEVAVVCDPNMGVSVFVDLEEGAPNDVFFFITEGGPLASLGTTVTMTNSDTTISFVTSDPFGGEMLANVPGGTYSYTIGKNCFDQVTGSVLVGCNGGMGISVFADILPSTDNNVFFFISKGSPLASIGAMVTLSNADTSYSFTTSDPFGGEMLADVPYGDYIWTVTKECFVEAAGDITVDCNEGMGVSVFVNLEAGGTNNVFFFITEGGPLASLGTMVTFANDDTSYSFTTSDPFGGEMLADVPAGDYTYTMTKDCFLEATGEVAVVCDPNMGVSVFVDLEEGAPNDVFFFITEGGPLASIGTTVTLTKSDTTISFVTSDPFGGEMLANVPGGTYSYTIGKNCFDQVTGSVLVGCNGGMGISVFADILPSTDNNVFFFISEGSPLASIGAMVTLSNADTSYSFTTSDPFGGEMLADVPYGDYIWTVTKECFIEAAGDITVDCNEGMGVSVFVNLEAGGTNNVFFFITEGGPLASLGTMVTFANDDTSYSFTTSDPFGGEMLADVPAGDYTYTMTKDCFLEATGEVAVVCDPNMGVSVFVDLEEGAPNDVFFFITEGGPLASIGTTVTLTKSDTTISFVTSDPFGGEMLANVPGGTYNYTIGKNCFDQVTGSVLVGCNGGMGISVFADILPSTDNNVFFFISEGSPLASLGTMVTLSNGDTSYSFTTSDPFGGELLENVSYGDYALRVAKDCFSEVMDSVTVDCNDGMGVSVFANLQEIVIEDSTSAEICMGDSFTFGTQTLTEAGEYQEIFSSSAGCDSLVTLTLSVNTVNTNVNQSGNTLTAEAADAEYQWLDCDNNFAPIDSANAQSYTATQDGNYAVLITENGCADTSACINVSTTAVRDMPWPNEVIAYPNPAEDRLTVEAGELEHEYDLRIVNTSGQIVLQKLHLNQSKIELKLNELPAGLYLLQLTSAEARTIISFVKN